MVPQQQGKVQIGTFISESALLIISIIKWKSKGSLHWVQHEEITFDPGAR